jgi:hypothetical protein
VNFCFLFDNAPALPYRLGLQLLQRLEGSSDFLPASVVIVLCPSRTG